jgi:hypothetical protein
LLVHLVGCGEDPATPNAEPPPEPASAVSWQVDRKIGIGGPVEVVLRVERTSLDLSEDVLVEEELRVDDGFVAEFPDVLPEDLEGLGLKRIQDLPDEQQGTRLVRRRRLHIEPERLGSCAIAERWAFFRETSQDVGQEKPLTCPRVDVEITPLPSGLKLGLPQAPSIFTVDPEPPPGTRWPWLAVLLPLLLLPLLRRREAKAPPAIPAHKVANDALARLDALDLLSAGDVEAYFVYLSAILRDYVEHRFGVRAPERTTQEFLREASAAPELATHGALLANFLQQADAVKFAGQRPSQDVATDARQTVAGFVAATQRRPETQLAGRSA